MQNPLVALRVLVLVFLKYIIIEYKFFNPFFARWLADRKTVLAACLQNGNNLWMKSKAKMLEFDTICGEGKN